MRVVGVVGRLNLVVLLVLKALLGLDGKELLVVAMLVAVVGSELRFLA